MLVVAALCNGAGYYIFALWFLSIFLLFFLISAAVDWMSTILGPSADLECRSEMCCTWLAGDTGHKKIIILAPSHKLSGYIFGTKVCVDNRKKTC